MTSSPTTDTTSSNTVSSSSSPSGKHPIPEDKADEVKAHSQIHIAQD